MRLARFHSAATLASSAGSGALAHNAAAIFDDVEIVNPVATARAFPGRRFAACAGRYYRTRAVRGDQHVHAGWSADAGAFRSTPGPEDPLRPTGDEELTPSLGLPAKPSRLLDWTAITDNSDAVGVTMGIKGSNPVPMAEPQARRWLDRMAAEEEVRAASEMYRT